MWLPQDAIVQPAKIYLLYYIYCEIFAMAGWLAGFVFVDLLVVRFLFSSFIYPCHVAPVWKIAIVPRQTILNNIRSLCFTTFYLI